MNFSSARTARLLSCQSEIVEPLRDRIITRVGIERLTDAFVATPSIDVIEEITEGISGSRTSTLVVEAHQPPSCHLGVKYRPHMCAGLEPYDIEDLVHDLMLDLAGPTLLRRADPSDRRDRAAHCFSSPAVSVLVALLGTPTIPDITSHVSCGCRRRSRRATQTESRNGVLHP